MAIQIPFPLPSHGNAQNSKVGINLQYLVDQFNQFNSGSATWDNVTIGTGNSLTGILSFYNASNNNSLSIQPGVTASNITFTLPTTTPAVNPSILYSSTGGVMKWKQLLGTTNQITLTDNTSDVTFSLPQAIAAGSSPTFAGLTLSSALTPGNGGTGQSSYTNGQLLIGNTTGNTLTKATLTGTTNQVVVTNGGGSITLSTPQNLDTGASVTFGTLVTTNLSFSNIASGTWNGTTIAVGYGGTGQISYTDGQLLVGNSSTTGLSKSTLTGTSNQVSITNGHGTITLSTPQDLGTSSDVQFGHIRAADGNSTSPGLSFSSETGCGFARTAASEVTLYGTTGSTIAIFNGNQTRIGGDLLITAAKGLILEGVSYNTTIKAASPPSAAWTLTLPVNGGTNNYVLATNGSGTTSWVNVASVGGASNALDNLASVAINTSLLPSSDNGIDLGSSSKQWRHIYSGTDILSPIFKSTSANPASAGLVRLASTDVIKWRNNANGADVSLAKDTSDILSWAGSNIVTSVSATADQTTVSASGNGVTIGTVQPINTTSSPGFVALALTATTNQILLGSTRTVRITAPTPATSSRDWTIPDITGNGTFAALEGTQTFSGAKTFSSDVTISGNHGLILNDGEGTPKTVTIKTPATLTSTWSLTLPVGAGTNGYVLTTNGSGVTSWTAAGSLTGSVNSGSANTFAYYATTGTTVSSFTGIDINGGGTQLSFHTPASGDVTSIAIGNDSTSASSDAGILVSAAAGTAGDAYLRCFIGGTTSAWTVGLDNSDSDNFKISHGNTLGTNDNLIISATTGAVSIQGSSTNDNAPAGFVGEDGAIVVTNTPNCPASATVGDLTSIVVPAGDWDLSATVNFFANGATFTDTSFQIGIATTSGTTWTGAISGVTRLSMVGVVPTTFNHFAMTFPAYRVSVASSTTYYLKGLVATYTVGQPIYNCRLSVRRAR